MSGEWLNFCTIVLGDAGLATDARFTTGADRVTHRADLDAAIDVVFATLTADEVVERLERAGIANARARTVEEFVRHPQLVERNRWREVGSPAGPIQALLPPVIVDGYEYVMGTSRRSARTLPPSWPNSATTTSASRPCAATVSSDPARKGATTLTIKEGWKGRFFEDFEVGDVYQHPLGRTVTTTDNIWFTLLTQNTAPIHFDHHYSAQTEFGEPLVDSTFTLALVSGQSVTDVSQNVFANLGWDEVRLPAPVFEGDTIYSQSEVLAIRESKSRPNIGIVTVKTTGYNQDGVVVIEFRRTVMVYKRGHAPVIPRVQPRS